MASLFHAHYVLRQKDATPSEKFLAKLERFEWISDQYAKQERRKLHEKARAIYARSGYYVR